MITSFISYLPIKFAIHANGIFIDEVPLGATAAVKSIINEPTYSATVYAAMYTIKLVSPGSGTNTMGRGLGSVWTKATFHNFPAVLQFLH